MKHIIKCLILTILFVKVLHAEPMKMKVNGDNVNLRAGADSHKEVVDQVSYGDILYTTGKDESGKWYRVLPPQGTKLYVYGPLIKEGKVSVKKLNVRSGPGINYTKLGEILLGQTVNAIEQRNDWLAINPPDGCYLWINTDYLEPIVIKKKEPVKITAPEKVEKKKNISKKPPKPVNRSFAGQITPDTKTTQKTKSITIHKKEPVKIPAALASKQLQQRPQGIYTKGYKGSLRKGSMFINSPSRYYLMKYDLNNRITKICYVLGNSDQLDKLVGKTLSIAGKSYWLEGYSTPIVVPKQITKSTN